MSALSYELSFAGVPFLLDKSRKVRDESVPHFVQEQRTEQDLFDEVENLLPRCQLHDFGPAHEFPGRSLSDLGVANGTVLRPSPDSAGIGDWYYPYGASRWSVFRGVASSSMVKAMLAQTSGGRTGLFKMKAVPSAPNNLPDASYDLQTQMHMLPARPLGEVAGTFDGLYLVTLVDERYYWQGSAVSLQVSQDSTWADLIDRVAEALDADITYSAIEVAYGKPEPDSQLWCNDEPPGLILDSIAYSLGRTVCRLLDGTYVLRKGDESAALVRTNRGQLNKVVRLAGGDVFASGTKLPVGDLNKSRDAAVPAIVRVSFPKYVHGDDPVPHFLNPRYRNQRPSCHYEDSYGAAHSVEVPVASGGPAVSGLTGTFDATVHSTAKALLSGEADAQPVNASGLTALAMQVARDLYSNQGSVALDESYPGTYKWTPEGTHDLIWTYSARRGRACLRVVKTEWNASIDQMQHGTPAGKSTETGTVKGVGGPSVAQTWRDSYGDVVETALYSSGGVPIGSGDQYLLLKSPGGFPTQNRWRAKLDDEVVLMEGTSGGAFRGLSGEYKVDVVYRGIDGTVASEHASGTALRQVVPNATYGVNLVTLDKMTFCHPMRWTSGGIQEVKLVAQTQTVTALASSGVVFSVSGLASGSQAGTYYSGRVNPVQLNSGVFTDQEFCWLLDRNGGAPVQDRRYDGQFVGYAYGDNPAPVYAFNGIVYASGQTSGTIDVVSNVCDELFKINPGVNVVFDYSVAGEVTINSTVNGSGAIFSGNSSVTFSGLSPWGLILCNSESSMDFTLSDPSTLGDAVFTFKKTGTSGVPVTINAAQLIDGAASYTITARWDYVTLKPYAGSYYVVGNGR